MNERGLSIYFPTGKVCRWERPFPTCARASICSEPGLGKLIFARTIAEAYRRLKPVTVYASARATNPASQAVCQACGLFPTDWYVGAIQNPAVFSESFTR